MLKKRSWQVLGLTLVLVCMPTLLAWAATIQEVRSSTAADKVRLVLNVDSLPRYAENVEGKQLILTLQASQKKKQILRLQDKTIRAAFIEPVGKQQSRLVLTFAEKVPNYKIFTLDNPRRLVLDLLRPVIFQHETQLAPGVTHTSRGDMVGSALIRAEVLTLTPESDYQLRPILGQGQRIQKGVLSKMVERSGALAAINASYFDSDIWVVGNLKVNNQWLSMEQIPRTALVLDQKGVPDIVPSLAYTGKVVDSRGAAYPLTGINRMRINNDLIYYTAAYDKTTDTNEHGVEVALEQSHVVAKATAGSMKLEPQSKILSGHGRAATFLQGMELGDPVELVHSLNQPEVESARDILGAGPLLVYEGKVQVRSAQEQIAPDIAYGRAPRTAVGITKKGSALLVVVDGRSSRSRGLTLQELATYLIRLGAYKAMNLDGGGSTEMVVRGRVVNRPSDGSERAIRVGLGVFPAK